ncbi:hypothetical protein FKP32DRAFT_57874 [Trametes sanguinea]|nr:hypothetical protein FKP32DRAFT_57874 [Trametes sanguinea]
MWLGTCRGRFDFVSPSLVIHRWYWHVFLASAFARSRVRGPGVTLPTFSRAYEHESCFHPQMPSRLRRVSSPPLFGLFVQSCSSCSYVRRGGRQLFEAYDNGNAYQLEASLSSHESCYVCTS